MKMSKIRTVRTSLAVAVMMAAGVNLTAQAQETAVEPDMLYAPLVYDNDALQPSHGQALPGARNGLYNLDAGDEWLQQAMAASERTRLARHRAMIDNPQLVAYNAGRLPEAPPEGVSPGDPRQGMLKITPAQVIVEDVIQRISNG